MIFFAYLLPNDEYFDDLVQSHREVLIKYIIDLSLS